MRFAILFVTICCSVLVITSPSICSGYFKDEGFEKKDRRSNFSENLANNLSPSEMRANQFSQQIYDCGINVCRASMKLLMEVLCLLSILLISAPITFTSSFASTATLSSTYGLLFIPSFSPSSKITTGSNVWVVAWTANPQTAGIFFVITMPDGSVTRETLGVSSCTIPLHSEPSGLCAMVQIPSLSQGVYKAEIYFNNILEQLEGCIYRSFNVTQGTPITTPQPSLPLDIKFSGPFTFGLMFNPFPPETTGSDMTLTAWTADHASGYVIFSVVAPGTPAINTTVSLSACPIPQRHRTMGMCAQLQIGPLVSGTYIIQSGFYVNGVRLQSACINATMDVS